MILCFLATFAALANTLDATGFVFTAFLQAWWTSETQPKPGVELG
jgi:hypothetical protein